MTTRTGFRLVAAALMGSLALSAGIGAPAAQAAHDRAVAIAHLRSTGVDPATAVFQTGVRNYAGPSCPGAGWSCVPSDRGPVVQQATSANSSNVFECTGSPVPSNSCTVVQTSTVGNNVARCILSSTANPVTQSCSITQRTQTGTNESTVDMDATQGAGATQTISQIAQIVQRSGGGRSRATAGTRAFQSADTTGRTQASTQNARQVVRLDQRATLAGPNVFSLDQDIVMRATSSGGASVAQRQNAASTQPDQVFDVFQSSNGGTNGFDAAQRIDQQAVANRPPSNLTQIQGSEQGGASGSLHQESSGVSSATISQVERQHAVGHDLADQEQYGPHICCDGTAGIPDVGQAPGTFHGRASGASTPDDPEPSEMTQTGNPANTLSIVQSADQIADDGSVQDDLAIGRFTTSGFGTVTQDVDQNGVVNTNSCSGQSCDTSQSCQNGQCDETPPETTITSAPASPSSSASATFAFASNEGGSTFQCSLDAGPFAGCSSPHTYNGLAEGAHTFSVRAIDAFGNVDPTPATHAWTIDLTAPETTITSGPATPTSSRSASLAFTSTEPGTFTCSLDGGAYATCTSPAAYTGLADGTHTFAVRATDPAGNTDATPATHAWMVDGTAPTSDFDPDQDGNVYVPGDPVGDPQITGTAADALSGIDRVEVTFTNLTFGTVETLPATLTCNEDATDCTWTISVPSFPGTYEATKSAVDEAGNAEPEDEMITFTVVP